MLVFTCIAIISTHVFIACILLVFIQYVSIYIVPICLTCQCQLIFNNDNNNKFLTR